MPIDRSSRNGFSLIELAIVCALILICLALALPILNQTLRGYRASADARNIASQLAMARMLAAHKFTHARLNLLSPNTYQVEIQSNTASCAAATWTADAGTYTLSQQVSFGAGTVTQPAPPQTGALSQPPNNVVIFNSRGTPIDCGGAPVGSYAIYLQNTSGEVYAVTVYPSSKTSVWRFAHGVWSNI